MNLTVNGRPEEDKIIPSNSFNPVFISKTRADLYQLKQPNSSWRGTSLEEAITADAPSKPSPLVWTTLPDRYGKRPGFDMITQPHAFKRSMRNSVAALYGRHIDPKIFPNPLMLAHFRLHATQWMQELGERFMQIDLPEANFDDWIKTVEPRKRSIYKTGWNQACMGEHLCTTLRGMVKTNEYTYLKDPIDMRPRNLFDPAPQLKVLGAFANHYILSQLRRVLPSISVGLNTG